MLPRTTLASDQLISHWFVVLYSCMVCHFKRPFSAMTSVFTLNSYCRSLMVILEEMTLLNTVSRNMQVQDSYGSNQQITWITKLWELKCLEYLYLQVYFVLQVMSGWKFIIKSFSSSGGLFSIFTYFVVLLNLYVVSHHMCISK